MSALDPSALPSVRAARETRARWAEDERRRAAGRLPEDLVAAAEALDGWVETLFEELGQSPTPDEQAERFEHLVEVLGAGVVRHHLNDFWCMIPGGPDGDTLRLLIAPPRTDLGQHVRDLLGTGDPLAFHGPLYFLPSQIRWWVQDYYALRRLPESLTLAGLQEWLGEYKLTAAGRERLAALQPVVGTLKAVLEEMGDTLSEFEFTPRGVDALVDRYFVRVHRGSREEYLRMTVEAALELIMTAEAWKRKKRTGRPKLGETRGRTPDPKANAKLVLYEYIREHLADREGPVALGAKLSGDARFKRLLKDAGKTSSKDVFRAAIAWIKANPVSQKT